jgi:hypothetical protein
MIVQQDEQDLDNAITQGTKISLAHMLSLLHLARALEFGAGLGARPFSCLDLLSSSGAPPTTELCTILIRGLQDAKNTAQASSADSKKVINAVNKLVPDNEDALNAIVNKKSQFAADGLTDTVQDDLKDLRADTDDFANALIAIASSDTKKQAQDLKTKIDNDFQKAQDAYAS